MIRAALCFALVPSLASAEPRFEDDSAGLPLQHVYSGGWEHFVGGGVAAFDCNGDDLPELFAAGGTAPARLLVNRSDKGGGLRFEAGEVAEITGVTGAYPLDLDSDGHLDLFVLRVGPNVVLRGLGECRFEEATEAWHLPQRDAWTTAFAATWEAGQGWPTVFTGNYVDRSDPEGPFEACDGSELIRPGAQGFGLVESIKPGWCTLSALISDWQRSGTPELRLSNDRHYYVKGGYEQMFRLATLEERTDWTKVSLWGMGIASRDLTGDGLPEVMMTSMGDQLLQFNRGGGFEDAPYAQGTTAHRPYTGGDGRPSTGWHAEFGDVDNDGRADLFISKGNVDQMPGMAMDDPNSLLMQGKDGRFAEAGLAAGIASLHRSRGAALADLNGDGLLDLAVVNRRAPMELWRNVTEGTGAWVGVAPAQSGRNRQAVGAWVELRGAAGEQAQEVTVGGGHAGGSALPLHFGLGAGTDAEVRVVWPDGKAGAWQPVRPGEVMRIERR
ncbi:CRTAC1 family protein [Alloyangia pacifica]|uniref:Repeat domain-containing protein n=1 Tax=Alloyangia pacifica TaxID=311180 RepID=A0A1I6VQZ8_9RHOB|nr:CRTAC1 family protein [Alloyangia pacifica]SDI10008.1 Repeat domain-containing protein [Alloyangia pacifica]SFT16011.1 Repeat domain-containing protein [Alloyangia pacifica]